jgi:hypothetical protein
VLAQGAATAHDGLGSAWLHVQHSLREYLVKSRPKSSPHSPREHPGWKGAPTRHTTRPAIKAPSGSGRSARGARFRPQTSRRRSSHAASASAPTTQTAHQISHSRLGVTPENGLNL